jgi:hypothetical protein
MDIALSGVLSVVFISGIISGIPSVILALNTDLEGHTGGARRRP